MGRNPTHYSKPAEAYLWFRYHSSASSTPVPEWATLKSHGKEQVSQIISVNDAVVVVVSA